MASENVSRIHCTEAILNTFSPSSFLRLALTNHADTSTGCSEKIPHQPGRKHPEQAAGSNPAAHAGLRLPRRLLFHQRLFRLYPALESVKKISILIALRNEQVVHGLIQIANDDSAESAPSTAEVKRTFGGMMRSELIQAQDSLAIETGIRKFIEWIRSDKLEVKLYREQNIHAKVYIMTPEHPVPDVNHGYVITGSSNLSHSGLEGNLEFNVLLAEPEEHDYALHRFNELWADAVDVKDVHETIITTVEKESPFAFFTPYELYLKFLADYFRDYLGDRSKLNTENLPQNFKKLQYQEDAVFTAQQMLKTYGGVFIADVVGLGKTYMSALLALQLDGRCLVIAPPSLLDENSPGSWPSVFREFCIPGHKCVSIGKLEEVLEQGVEFYKYVFIDESHRFKTDSTQRYKLLTRICQTRASFSFLPPHTTTRSMTSTVS